MDDQAKIALLQKVIQFNTVNGNEQPLAEYLKEVRAQHHIDSQLVKFADNRTCLVAEIGNQPGKVLAFPSSKPKCSDYFATALSSVRITSPYP